MQKISRQILLMRISIILTNKHIPEWNRFSKDHSWGTCYYAKMLPKSFQFPELRSLSAQELRKNLTSIPPVADGY